MRATYLINASGAGNRVRIPSRKILQDACDAALNTDIPVYLANTAGGGHAMARHFDTIARMRGHIGDMGMTRCCARAVFGGRAAGRRW